jgi:glycerol-3-phosphate cytidylyltransferase-like family protein
MLEAIRYVNRVVLADGPVEPEIERIRPDIYLVNADGDRPEKQEFCRKHNLQYVVLQRLPREGLPARQSTYLRGY